MARWSLYMLLGVLLGTGVAAWAVEPTPAETYRKEIADKYAAAENAKMPAIVGKDGWLFFSYELRALSVGPFWGAAAAGVSRATKPEFADPLPAILDFKRQLDAAGITLLIVPVPAKATIYPDMLSAAITTPEPRLDTTHQAFYQLLGEKGVRVLDLTPAFLKQRATNGPSPFCTQDSHWSGEACALTAQLISEAVQTSPWLKTVPRRTLVSIPREIEITGDLWTMLQTPTLPKEKLTVKVVQERTPAGLVPVKPWRESPVLLLGDSHTLIFHAGEDMLASGAGLADHLALRLGFPVDVVGVRGSGATPSRISLLRRGDNLAGKKLVIWCFSIREFTEGQGWRLVPVIK
jgi:hypothetical protein